LLKEYETQDWADALLKGPYGQLAPSTLKELSEAIAATRAMFDIRKTRADLLDPVHEAYMRYKRVVRDSIGKTSHEYRRIHVRAAPLSDADSAPASVPP
jgi:hypothetical protein